MSIPTDQNRELLSVVATMRAKPGKEQELRELLATPHLQSALPRIPELLDGDLVITPLQRIA